MVLAQNQLDILTYKILVFILLILVLMTLFRVLINCQKEDPAVLEFLIVRLMKIPISLRLMLPLYSSTIDLPLITRSA